jgi:acetylornithine deacetylase
MNALIAAGRTDDRFEPNHTSLHVGKFNGGTAFNVIANHCAFDWDFRTIPSDDQSAIFQEFADHCRAHETELRKRFPDFSITHEEHHPPVPPLDTPEEQSVVALAKELTGRTQTHTVSYAAEAGQFALGGFETVICGPGSIAQAHRANEFIAIEQLEGGVAMLQRLIRKQCIIDSMI